MGSATYTPPPGEVESTQTHGLKFEAGKSVTINNPVILRKLAGNSHFDVQISDEEREAAEQQGSNPLAGAVFTGAVPSHRPYYGTSPAAATDDPEARAVSDEYVKTPTTAIAAGGGLNTSTLGDVPTPEQIEAKYGTDNPLDSMEPGEPIPPSNVKAEIVQAQADRAPKPVEQQQQRRGPGRPPNRRPESE